MDRPKLTGEEYRNMIKARGWIRSAHTMVKALKPPHFHLEYQLAQEALSKAELWWEQYSTTITHCPDEAGYAPKRYDFEEENELVR